MASTSRRRSLIVEPNGFQGARLPVLADPSSERRAMSVFWNVAGDAPASRHDEIERQG
jgi:hypothetical protein